MANVDKVVIEFQFDKDLLRDGNDLAERLGWIAGFVKDQSLQALKKHKSMKVPALYNGTIIGHVRFFRGVDMNK